MATRTDVPSAPDVLTADAETSQPAHVPLIDKRTSSPDPARHDSASRSQHGEQDVADTSISFDDWASSGDRVAKVQTMIDSPDDKVMYKLAKLFGEYISTPRPELSWTQDIFAIVELLQNAKLFDKVKTEPDYPLIFDQLVLNRMTKADRQLQKTQCYLNRVTSVPGWANFPNDLPPKMRGQKIGEKTMQVIARLAERRGATYDKVAALLRHHCGDGTQHLTVGKAQAAVKAADEDPSLIISDTISASPPPPSRPVKRSATEALDEPSPKRVDVRQTPVAMKPSPAPSIPPRSSEGPPRATSSSEITAGHGLLTLSNFRAYNSYPDPTPARAMTPTMPAANVPSNPALYYHEPGSSGPRTMTAPNTPAIGSLDHILSGPRPAAIPRLSTPANFTSPDPRPRVNSPTDGPHLDVPQILRELTEYTIKIEQLQQSLTSQVCHAQRSIDDTKALLEAKYKARTAFSEQIDRQQAASDVNERMMSDGIMTAEVYQQLTSGLDAQTAFYRQAKAKAEREIADLDERLAADTSELDRADLSTALKDTVKRLSTSTTALEDLMTLGGLEKASKPG